MKHMPEEINLYLLSQALVRQWRWILAIMLLACGLGAAGNLLLPTIYEATATVSVPGDQSPRSSLYPHISSISFQTVEVAQAVVTTLGSQGITIQQDASALLTHVRISESSDGSTWNITASSDTPERATQLSNAWADYIAKSINDELFSTPQVIQSAANNAQDASNALQTFVQAHILADYDLYHLAQTKPIFPRVSSDKGAVPPGLNSTQLPDTPVLTPTEKTQLALLLRAQEIADAVYSDLLVQVAEKQMLAKTGEGVANVIKPASVPKSTTIPKSTENIVIAGAIGLMVGVFGVLFIETAKKAND